MYDNFGWLSTTTFVLLDGAARPPPESGQEQAAQMPLPPYEAKAFSGLADAAIAGAATRASAAAEAKNIP